MVTGFDLRDDWKSSLISANRMKIADGSFSSLPSVFPHKLLR